MLPKSVQKSVIYRPVNRESDEANNKINWYLSHGYSKIEVKKMIIIKDDARNILNQLNINQNISFYEYYLNWCDEPMAYRSESLYGLSEILENQKDSYWSRYTEIGKRYLQLSSIEGEYSYFYDKETDALYGVDWGEMDDFIAGKLKPLFTSFYDFLEWYYSNEDE